MNLPKDPGVHDMPNGETGHIWTQDRGETYDARVLGKFPTDIHKNNNEPPQRISSRKELPTDHCGFTPPDPVVEAERRLEEMMGPHIPVEELGITDEPIESVHAEDDPEVAARALRSLEARVAAAQDGTAPPDWAIERDPAADKARRARITARWKERRRARKAGDPVFDFVSRPAWMYENQDLHALTCEMLNHHLQGSPWYVSQIIKFWTHLDFAFRFRVECTGCRAVAIQEVTPACIPPGGNATEVVLIKIRAMMLRECRCGLGISKKAVFPPAWPNSLPDPINPNNIVLTPKRGWDVPRINSPTALSWFLGHVGIRPPVDSDCGRCYCDCSVDSAARMTAAHLVH